MVENENENENEWEIERGVMSNKCEMGLLHLAFKDGAHYTVLYTLSLFFLLSSFMSLSLYCYCLKRTY